MKKDKIIKFNCRCVAGKDCDKMIVQKFYSGNEFMFDIWRGKKVYGVVLNEKDIKKLIKFIK